MDAPYLLLWLEGPLQAWGYDSKFDRRDSLDFPTKSGVLGLFCCALGKAGKQIDWLTKWADFDMQVVAYVRKDKNGNAVAREPLLCDFHMVGSGYNHTDKWQNLLIPKTSDGSKATTPGAAYGGTKVTYRYYLQDMTFAVAIQGSETELKEAAKALQSPVWDLYLGRKNCTPTEFVYQGIFPKASQALEKADEIAERKNRAKSFYVMQGEQSEGEVITLNDVPTQFGVHKKYRGRKVSIMDVGS